MIGETILHYKILEKLGEGGMGIVYLAEDTKLKRQVAIKFLPRHISSNNEERKRFEIEAQAAASLNHTNIATIYAIEEFEDNYFIVMEYINGKELKEIIFPLSQSGDKGGLPINDIINYATQIAEGLEAAHKKGIVHRDIKSQNIMVTEEGKVKIMDFGLAKVGKGSQVTKLGTTIGTIAYMSPEQTKGEEVDHQTDIWSFGVVLYEMLTGELPFKGDYDQAVIYSILNETQTPLTNFRNDLPVELDAMATKSLSKNPEDRFKRLDEIIYILKSLQQGKFSSSLNKQKNAPQKIAVLPFSNLRSDPQTDFLGFAMADQIISALTYMKNILVRPSSAVRKYQNQIVDIPAAGNELRADYILTGYYLKEADDIRLNVEMIKIKSNEMLWRESIQQHYENAFKLQDIVSEKVMQGLEVQFSKDEQQRIKTNIPKNPIAYEYYLRGVSYPHTNEGDRLAIQILKKSIELDSMYAPAYSELGFRLSSTGMAALKGTEAYKEAEEFHLKALSLNGELLSSLLLLANLYTESGRTEKAMEFIERMLKINPSNSFTHFGLSYLLRYTGMLDESAKEGEIVLMLDPKNPVFRSLGYTYFYMGKYQKAIDIFGLDKGSIMEIAWKGYALLLMGNKSEAMKYFDKVIELEPEGHFGHHFGALRAVELGNIKVGLQYANKWEQTYPSDSESLYTLANTYAYLGDKESCFRNMGKAIEGGFFCYPYFLVDPMLNHVRDDDQFKNLLEIAKAKHEAFKKKFYQKDFAHMQLDI